jgi:tagatose 6-phosphate kinase
VVLVILTITLNPAWDVTYQVAALRPGQTHRVESVAGRAGGKGVNVARVLAVLGERVLASGLAGGPTGDAIMAELPVPHDFAPVAAESRRTVTVWSTVDGRATLFAEPGPAVAAAEWSTFKAGFDRLASIAEVVVLAGSLPPGLPASSYAELIDRSPAPVILDADAEPLRQGLAAHPALVTPNVDELAAALGSDGTQGSDMADLASACQRLAVPVAVTLGAEGAVLSTSDGAWSARPPEVIRGNPTGAGDAFTAALARGLARRTAMPELLADAVALSAAAVTVPVAGSIDVEAYRRLRSSVVVREL